MSCVYLNHSVGDISRFQKTGRIEKSPVGTVALKEIADLIGLRALHLAKKLGLNRIFSRLFYKAARPGRLP